MPIYLVLLRPLPPSHNELSNVWAVAISEKLLRCKEE